MKKNIFCKIIILFVSALVFSCSQDAIFFKISTEPIPKKPRIQGGPTKMVVFERIYADAVSDTNPEGKVPVMYVASGRLHWYARTDGGLGDSRWNLSEYDIPQPGGKIIDLAATNEYLYAMCLKGHGVTAVLKRIGPSVDDTWQDVPIDADSKYSLIQSVYADKSTGRLFTGAMNNSGSDYGILYLYENLPDTPALRLLISDSGMLSGAVCESGVHYLSTRGKGIYIVTETALSLAEGPAETDVVQLEEIVDEGKETDAKKDRLFMGMIKLEDGSTVAVERNGGTFFEVTTGGFKKIKYSGRETNVSTGKYATGALALWQEVVFDDNGDPGLGDRKMLVAGIQGGLYNTTTSSYTHGYVEFELTSAGSLDLESTRNNSPSITVRGNTDRYTATIGKHPINYLFQSPDYIDANMTFFASTQTAGLWSYRNRSSGGWQWNAEE